MKKSHFIAILASLVAVSAGLFLGQVTSTNSSSTIKPEVIQGAIYPKAKIINDFLLLNQNAQTVSKKDFLQHWSLIFIGYTHCPDVCPTTLAVMNQVSKVMQQQNIEAPQIVFLSVDPERDTVDTLKPYIEYFNKDFIGLTGSLPEITRFSRELNAVFQKAAGSSGYINNADYLMDHSSALMLINPNGNLQAILTAPHTPGNIIESILKAQSYYTATQL